MQALIIKICYYKTKIDAITKSSIKELDHRFKIGLHIFNNLVYDEDNISIHEKNPVLFNNTYFKRVIYKRCILM